MTCDMWHVTCDIWHVTCDTWHVTCCDLWYLEDWEEKADRLTDLNNDKGVCRTAPATPGLLDFGTAIRIGREIQCLPYAGFLIICFKIDLNLEKDYNFWHSIHPEKFDPNVKLHFEKMVTYRTIESQPVSIMEESCVERQGQLEMNLGVHGLKVLEGHFAVKFSKVEDAKCTERSFIPMSSIRLSSTPSRACKHACKHGVLDSLQVGRVSEVAIRHLS